MFFGTKLLQGPGYSSIKFHLFNFLNNALYGEQGVILEIINTYRTPAGFCPNANITRETVNQNLKTLKPSVLEMNVQPECCS